jgi:RNA 3'-terminal phosphate cyclase (ATP)
VGQNAAMEIIENLHSNTAVDAHLADQLIPFLGLAGKGSLTTNMLTGHLKTNIKITEQLLDVKFEIEKEENIKIAIE